MPGGCRAHDTRGQELMPVSNCLYGHGRALGYKTETQVTHSSAHATSVSHAATLRHAGHPSCDSADDPSLPREKGLPSSIPLNTPPPPPPPHPPTEGFKDLISTQIKKQVTI